MQNIQKGRLLILAGGLCWSSAGALVKSSDHILDGFQISGYRSIFSFLFFALLVRPWQATRWWPGFKVFLVSIAYAIMMIVYILAVTKTTAANAIFLQSSAPIWIMLMAPIFLKEPIRMRDLVVLLICGSGIVLFFLDDLTLKQNTGNILALFSGVAYAIVMVGLRWGRPKMKLKNKICTATGERPTNAELIVLWGNGLCVIGCLPWMIHLPPIQEAALPLAYAALLGVVQLGLGYYLVTKGIKYVPAAEASLFALIEPVSNPIWTYLVVAERPGNWAIVGSVVVLLGLSLQGLMGLRKK